MLKNDKSDSHASTDSSYEDEIKRCDNTKQCVLCSSLINYVSLIALSGTISSIMWMESVRNGLPLIIMSYV